MITTIIIKTLREDSTIQTLLDASGVNDCPVSATFDFDRTVNKQINVSYELGETQGYASTVHDGEVNVFILVRDTLSKPIETLHSIANRVITLLDLEGSETDSTLRWLQKVDTDFNHYENTHFYELNIVFRFVIEEA